jgi:hypothetical protein
LHACDYEEYGVLGSNAMQFRDSSMLWRNTLPPSSGPKSKPSKKPAEAGIKLQNVQLSLNCTAFHPRSLYSSRKRTVNLFNNALCIGTMQWQTSAWTD